MSNSSSKKKFFVIDVMAMAFRSFYVFAKRPLTTSEGFPTSAIYGCALSLLKILSEEKPDYLAFASDSPERTFRHDLSTAYKANRSEMPPDLARQIPHIYRFFERFRVPMLRMGGFEADDIIGSLCHKFSGPDLHVYIVSKDKDFMQLVSPDVSLLRQDNSGVFEIVDPSKVFEKTGCRPDQIRDFLAICGDSSDNIQGVKGIGDKGAVKLLQTYDSLSSIYANLDSIANLRQKNALIASQPNMELTQTLVTIKTDIPLGNNLDDFAIDREAVINSDEILAFCEEMEFVTLVKRLAKDNGTKPTREVKPAPEVVFESSAKADYNLIQSPEGLARFLEEIDSCPSFAFDTETTGLDIIDHRPIGVSFSLPNSRSFYLPLLEKHLKQLPVEVALAALGKLFADPKKLKIAHNIKFDLQMLDNIGITAKGHLADSMLAAFLLDAQEKSFGIDHLSQKFLKFKKIPTSDLIGPKGLISMSDVALEKLFVYACEDAACAYRLGELFIKKLHEEGLYDLFATCEMPLAPILAKMEQTGVHVDPQTLFTLSDQISGELEETRRKIHAAVGSEFNINSPKQLQVVLYEQLKIPEALGITNLKKTKSGFSTDISVLESMNEHPLVADLIEFRTLSKLQNTYLDTLPQLIHEKTGRIHTNFHQAGTATGRLSSSKPNLQNIPIRTERGKEIRSAFCAQEGNVLISADYSQVELRILAHLTGDEGLRQAFAAGGDIHAQTAATMFKKDIKSVGALDRSRAKAINFGIIYGMGAKRLAKSTGSTLEEAKTFIDRYFSGFPRIKGYIEESVRFAREHGYSRTILGRKRPISGLDGSLGNMAFVSAKNIATNSPIQGSAADLIKIAMIHINDALEKRKVKAKLLLQVHDELLFECSKDDELEARQIIKAGMEQALELTVPIVAEMGSGRTWLEAH